LPPVIESLTGLKLEDLLQRAVAQKQAKAVEEKGRSAT
jgi:hypothetical protein